MRMYVVLVFTPMDSILTWCRNLPWVHTTMSQKLTRLSISFSVQHSHYRHCSFLRRFCSVGSPIAGSKVALCPPRAIRKHLPPPGMVLGDLAGRYHVQGSFADSILILLHLIKSIFWIQAKGDRASSRTDVYDAGRR